jgi:hypothetical protein
MSIRSPVMPVTGSIEVSVSGLMVISLSGSACTLRPLSAHHSGKSHQTVARFRGVAGVSMPARLQQNYTTKPHRPHGRMQMTRTHSISQQGG